VAGSPSAARAIASRLRPTSPGGRIGLAAITGVAAKALSLAAQVVAVAIAVRSLGVQGFALQARCMPGHRQVVSQVRAIPVLKPGHWRRAEAVASAWFRPSGSPETRYGSFQPRMALHTTWAREPSGSVARHRLVDGRALALDGHNPGAGAGNGESRE